jgi:hypothetical protein
MTKPRTRGEQVFYDEGITMSIIECVAESEPHFPLSRASVHAGQDPVYNPVMLRRLRKSIEHAKQGKYVVKTMEELRRMEG